jgi:hypothetical protein
VLITAGPVVNFPGIDEAQRVGASVVSRGIPGLSFTGYYGADYEPGLLIEAIIAYFSITLRRRELRK